MVSFSEAFTYCLITALVSCDTCDGVTCHNGGTCEAGPADFWCECSKGWTGRNCDLNGRNINIFLLSVCTHSHISL